MRLPSSPRPPLRKCKAEPQTSNQPQASCPLVCTHTWGSETPGEAAARGALLPMCSVPWSLCPIVGFAVRKPGALCSGFGDGATWEQPGALDSPPCSSLPHPSFPLCPPRSLLSVALRTAVTLPGCGAAVQACGVGIMPLPPPTPPRLHSHAGQVGCGLSQPPAGLRRGLGTSGN